MPSKSALLAMTDENEPSQTKIMLNYAVANHGVDAQICWIKNKDDGDVEVCLKDAATGETHYLGTGTNRTDAMAEAISTAFPG